MVKGKHMGYVGFGYDVSSSRSLHIEQLDEDVRHALKRHIRLTVQELADVTGYSLQRVLEALARLRVNNLVRRSRNGTQDYYEIIP